MIRFILFLTAAMLFAVSPSANAADYSGFSLAPGETLVAVNGVTVSQNCPNGQCPAVNRVVRSRTVQRTALAPAIRQTGVFNVRPFQSVANRRVIRSRSLWFGR